MRVLDFHMFLEKNEISSKVAALLELLYESPKTYAEICETFQDKLDDRVYGSTVRVIQKYSEFFHTSTLSEKECNQRGIAYKTRPPVIVSLTNHGQVLANRIIAMQESRILK